MSTSSPSDGIRAFCEIKKQFDVLFGSSPVATYVMHPYEVDGTTTLACNQAFLDFHNKTEAEALDFDDLPSPELILEWEKAWRLKIETIDVTRVRREGVIENFGYSDNAENTGVKATLRIITLAKRELLLVTDEKILNQNADLVGVGQSGEDLSPEQLIFQSLFRYLPDGAFLYDPSEAGRPMIDCNLKYEKLTGYTRDELIGHTVLDLGTKQNPAEYQEWLQSDMSDYLYQMRNFRSVFEGAHRRKDGTLLSVEVLQNVAYINNRELVLTIVQDRTRERRKQQLEADRDTILELLATNAPLEDSLQAICRLIENQIQGASCMIWSTKPKLLQSLHDFSAQKILESDEGISATEHFLTEVADQPYTVLIYDGEREPIPSQLQFRRGMKSCWVFSLKEGAESPSSVLLVFKETTSRPDAEEFMVINSVTPLTAIAIEQQLLTQQLAHQAKHDILTGLPNRSLFNDRLEYTLALAKRNRKKLGVLFVDLDGFKPVNDSLGHATGDLLLKEVAQRLKNCVRESDTVARMGGDEFTLILANINEAQDAALVAQKVISELQQPFHLVDHDIYVTASVGITIFPDLATEADALVIQADSAMYVAKTSGKNSHQFYNPGISATFQKNLELKAQLRKGLSSNEFQVFYQPEVSIKTGEIIGLEALLRWKHPQLGLMLPPSFLPAAEETGLILKIGEWVLEQACGQVQQWQQNLDLPKLHISINISPLQLSRNEFFKSVERVLEQTGLPPHTLQFEVAESVIMTNVEEAARYMHSLKKMGVRLLVDDFAMSYSSLTYLKKLPVDAIKIDRTFIQSIDHDPVSRSLVEAIITFGHSMELPVYATGIESARQYQLLNNLGCDFAQGFYFAKPGDTAQTEALLTAQGQQYEQRERRWS